MDAKLPYRGQVAIERAIKMMRRAPTSQLTFGFLQCLVHGYNPPWYMRNLVRHYSSIDLSHGLGFLLSLARSNDISKSRESALALVYSTNQ
ncbi:hypothetical protein RRG08_001744 [Elysia crispata]|uniref:Uncharacterized protein n=1 Tax=Elysia crispata TaxID=231223 RepID=A0AAE1ALI3_9GAST|nr:hypothetical protein RRG08_001744 [Elysia crispata]